MSLPSLPLKSDGTSRSFWERPEGGLGMFTIGALALGGFALVKIFGDVLISTLDTVTAIVGKTMALGFMLGGAALLLAIVLNPKVHNLVGYAFKLSMRWTMGQIVELDPIGIMRIYVAGLKERLKTIDERLGNLSGQIRAVESTVAKNSADHKTALNTAKAAHEAGKAAFFSVNAKQAQRLEMTNLRYDDVLKKMKFLKTMLLKYREASEAMILDMSNEIDVQEVERKAMLAAYSAMTAVREILAGSGDKREMFDLAMEFTVNDYHMKIGEIDHFMETSQSFLDGLDLSNGAANTEALAKLQEWENSADSLLLGNSKQQALQSFGVQPLIQPIPSSYLKQ